MNDVLFSVIQIVVVIILGLVSRYVIPWLKMKLDSEKGAQLLSWVQTAVTAAEQIITGESKGSERKAFVTEYMAKLLKEKGINITDEQLNLLIESAVKALNTKGESK